MTVTPPTRAELQERIPVTTRAELTAARVEMARRLAAAHGVERKGARIPHDYAMLYTSGGVALERYEREQAERIRNARERAPENLPYHLGLSAGYLDAALERTAPDEADEAEADEHRGPTGYDTTRELIDDLGTYEPSLTD